MAELSRSCGVWVGSETGILKGVSVSRKKTFNFCGGGWSRDHEVCALCWGDAAESELLLAALNGDVLTFSLEKGAFTGSRRCADPVTHGRFTGVAVAGTALVTCVESGQLRVWPDESSAHVSEVRAGPGVCRMRQNPSRTSTVATGGQDNGLKVWDLTRPEQAVFSAKNVKNDWLDLRQHEWVRDLAFIPNSEKIITCTGHHQVRVYDPSSPQRRPVLEAHYGEYPLTALSLPATGNTVVVGNTQGNIAVLDLRKGLVRGCLKGLAGGVRALQCHASLPVVASCGLDRFLRIHSLEDRSLLHKVYLKSRLNCLLLASKDLHTTEEESGEVEEVKQEDEVWDSMEQIDEERMKRKATEEEDEEDKGVQKRKSKKTKRKAQSKQKVF